MPRIVASGRRWRKSLQRCVSGVRWVTGHGHGEIPADANGRMAITGSACWRALVNAVSLVGIALFISGRRSNGSGFQSRSTQIIADHSPWPSTGVAALARKSLNHLP